MIKLKKSLKIFFIFSLLIFLPLCVPREKIEIPPQQLQELKSKIEEAEILFKKGSYSCLKESLRIYQDLLSFPAYQRKIRENLLKTSLILCLRENELGLINDRYFQEAYNLIQNYPYLSEFSIYLELIQINSAEARGSAGNIFKNEDSVDRFFKWIKENVERLNKDLKEKSRSEEFFAYFYLHLNSEFPYHIKEKDGFSRFYEIFPNSSLIHYKLALFPKVNQKKLKELLKKETSFHETYYFLGEIELMLGKLISAEKNFLKANKNFPRSLSVTISLTKIYFAFEEFEKCLEFNEKALDLSPDYRDALLGKAICLCYLGRNEEAIEMLNKLIELGMYLMGETHYWLAWNWNELEKYEDAWKEIENAKKYLIGNHEVNSLSGIIAFKKGNLDEAEKDFKEALRMNPSSCESAFYLGKICARRGNWKDSGLYFERAASCQERIEDALEKKTKEIENSDFSEERKKKLILRKKMQERKTRLTKATSFYNAAAGYFNAGEKKRSLSLAQKAALHSSFKEKADKLIESIKKLDE